MSSQSANHTVTSTLDREIADFLIDDSYDDPEPPTPWLRLAGAVVVIVITGC